MLAVKSRNLIVSSLQIFKWICPTRILEWDENTKSFQMATGYARFHSILGLCTGIPYIFLLGIYLLVKFNNSETWTIQNLITYIMSWMEFAMTILIMSFNLQTQLRGNELAFVLNQIFKRAEIIEGILHTYFKQIFSLEHVHISVFQKTYTKGIFRWLRTKPRHDWSTH